MSGVSFSFSSYQEPRKTPAFRLLFYTHITNGVERRDERPPAAFGHATSPSTGFSTLQAHRPGGPTSRPVGPPPSSRLRSSFEWALDWPGRPHRPADHPRAPRVQAASPSRRARSRSHSQRTARGDTHPEPPDQAVSRLDLTRFKTAACFEAVLVIFHD